MIRIKLQEIGMVMTNKSATPDYFKLPFEVHYEDSLGVIQYEFKSDVKPTSFKDVKAVHVEEGESWGATFSCSENSGSELYCCLMNRHDHVAPTWLNFEDEEDLSFNSGCDYSVVIEGREIKFVELTEEQEDEESESYLNVKDMGYCCSYPFMAYEIGISSPDFIILDAGNSRIKIDLEGYALDDEGERIDVPRIINTDELDDEGYEDYETLELYEAKRDWVKSILEEDFPKDKGLTLSSDSA
jgi:hypothetical protein